MKAGDPVSRRVWNKVREDLYMGVWGFGRSVQAVTASRIQVPVGAQVGVLIGEQVAARVGVLIGEQVAAQIAHYAWPRTGSRIGRESR